VIAERLDRLMGGFEVPPDQIQDSGRDRSGGVHVTWGSHSFSVTILLTHWPSR
jgi:hypothetical protein